MPKRRRESFPDFSRRNQPKIKEGHERDLRRQMADVMRRGQKIASGREPRIHEMRDIERKMWDLQADFRQGEIRDDHIRILEEHRAIQEDERMLSIGSTGGEREAYVAKHMAPEGFVTGLDFSHGMNLRAKTLAEREEVANVGFVEADAGFATAELPIKSNSQNTVLVKNNVIKFIFDKNKLIAEAKRVLRKSPASQLIIEVSEANNIPEEPIRQMLNANGFRVVYEECPENNVYVLIANLKPSIGNRLRGLFGR